jgi:hypothetical protein
MIEVKEKTDQYFPHFSFFFRLGAASLNLGHDILCCVSVNNIEAYCATVWCAMIAGPRHQRECGMQIMMEAYCYIIL